MPKTTIKDPDFFQNDTPRQLMCFACLIILNLVYLSRILRGVQPSFLWDGNAENIENSSLSEISASAVMFVSIGSNR
jgi:hypothetical protein